MNLSIRPDPDHPHGGHAILRLSGVLSGEPRGFTIKRVIDGHFLGPDGWHGERHVWPVAELERDAGGLELKAGPEIVDRVPAREQLEVALVGTDARATAQWPDAVMVSPRRGRGGRVRGGRRPAEPVTEEPPAPEPVPELAPPAPPTPEPIAAPPKERPGWLLPVFLMALLLFAAVGGAAFWLLGGDTEVATDLEAEPPAAIDPPVDADPPEDVAPLPEPTDTAGCTREALLQLTRQEERPLAELMAFADSCGTEQPELRLTAVEAAAAAGHPPALFTFCAWYDPTDPSRTASPLAANAVSALRYCAQAAAAGEPGAAAAKLRLCAALAPETDPIAVMSRETYCRE